MTRNQEIIRTSIINIIGNVFLAAFKLGVGLVTNSIAIVADAVNNATDVLSSVITIVGTRLSEKEPDRKHPFGYGRIEYVTSLVIGMIIIYAGISVVRESIKLIIEPEHSEYSLRALIIVAVAVIVKVLMGVYAKRKGRELESAAITASGHDAIDDSIETAAAFIAAVIHVRTGVSLEAFVGLAISIFIFKTGFETIRETVSSILGERVDVGLVTEVRKSILSFPEIDGVFDIVIHNYGKEKLIGSAHIAVPDRLTSAWIDNLQRAVTRQVYEDTGVELLGLTIYAENSRDDLIRKMKHDVKAIAGEYPSVTGVYGFYLDRVDKVIRFEVVTDFDVRDTKKLRESIREKVSSMYPEYEISIDVKKDIAG